MGSFWVRIEVRGDLFRDWFRQDKHVAIGRVSYGSGIFKNFVWFRNDYNCPIVTKWLKINDTNNLI